MTNNLLNVLLNRNIDRAGQYANIESAINNSTHLMQCVAIMEIIKEIRYYHKAELKQCWQARRGLYLMRRKCVGKTWELHMNWMMGLNEETRQYYLDSIAD